MKPIHQKYKDKWENKIDTTKKKPITKNQVKTLYKEDLWFGYMKWQMTINNNKEELWADSWAQLMEQM